jgi:hypothetical protein
MTVGWWPEFEAAFNLNIPISLGFTGAPVMAASFGLSVPISLGMDAQGVSVADFNLSVPFELGMTTPYTASFDLQVPFSLGMAGAEQYSADFSLNVPFTLAMLGEAGLNASFNLAMTTALAMAGTFVPGPPTITTVSPSTGDYDTAVTLTGTGFLATTTDNGLARIDIGQTWRYLRIYNPLNQWMAVLEFELRDAAAAKYTGITYTQSNVYSEAIAATEATMNDGSADGSVNAATAMNQVTDNYLRADLGSSKFIDHIIIGYDYLTNFPTGWGPQYTNGFAVQGSNDGSAWTDIATTPTYASRVKVPTPVGTTTVTVGGQAVRNLVIVSDTSITFNPPGLANGAYDVVVTNANGSATATAGFTYSFTPQTVTTAQTNTARPVGSKGVKIRCIRGAGGGGGNPYDGFPVNDPSWCYGGGGGGGGGFVSTTGEEYIPTSQLGATYSITIAAQPAAGAAGGSSLFTSGSVSLTAHGGSFGGAGTSSGDGTGGAGGTTSVSGVSGVGFTNSNGGGGGGGRVAGVSASGSGRGAGGGGGGAGNPSSGSMLAAGAGGARQGGSGGIAGSPGSAGTNATDSTTYGGSGGGGGTPTYSAGTVDTFAGGNGINLGGSGGGGSSGKTSAVSFATRSRGGSGRVTVEWV